jgi:hypothetical protein
MRIRHPFIRPAGFLPALLLCGLCGTAAADRDAFLVRARVLQAEPVVESVPVPLETERCTYSDRAARADRAMAGDVRSSHPGLTIGNGIAEEIRHRQANARRYRCRIETEWTYREEVVAYRVFYEYDGETFEQLFPEHPGDWIDLKVRLSTR